MSKYRTSIWSWLLLLALSKGLLTQNSAHAQVPLAELLNRDGTLDLKRGFHGGLDPAGWQMMTAPNGEPRFVPISAAQSTVGGAKLMAVPGDEKWDDRFGTPGPNALVTAIVVNGSEIYMGGWFTTTGGVVTNCIAKWNGTSWSALGSGMNGFRVTAIAVSGGEVYAGGDFTTAGGVPANHIAKWNGTSWSALGSGMNGYSVDAIAISGNDVYAGGYFTTAGGATANYIAKWDGTSWSALGSGLNYPVFAIAVNGNDVYVGGWFTSAGEVPANYIAKWDGTSWSALGSGMTYVVNAIAISGSEVYAGGRFTSAGGVPANNIAKWDGTSWSALGSGTNSQVQAIAINGSEVYVGGWFTTAGGAPVSRIAKWDGTSWSELGSGVNRDVYAITVSGSEVYAGGAFTIAGGVLANGIAKWDGTDWMELQGASNLYGLNAPVEALASSGGEVYAGGLFTMAGRVPANNIAKWDGMNWSALGSGMNAEVLAIAISGSEVYAGGWFTSAGGVPANYIAKWDGTSWSALGGGMNAGVLAIVVSGSELYVGGAFTLAGGVPVDHIAKWDGTSWSPLGTGMNSWVATIAVSGSELYAGGYFTTAGGVPANYIAKWNGTNWAALGSGMNTYGYVSAIAVSSREVYAGGNLTMAGGVAANHIAKWDGTSWSALGSGMNGHVWEIAANNGEVYVGGEFTYAGGVPAKHIAKWDGTSWLALGSGMGGERHFDSEDPLTVSAFALTGSELYAGGWFVTAGDKPSLFFGRYIFNNPPTADAGIDQQICDGKTVAIGGDPAASGGIAPYTYNWAPTTGLDNAMVANPLASPTATTTYKLTVTDANGQTHSDEMTLTVNGTCKRFVLLANKITLKGTKQSMPAGDIHSNGSLTVEKGDPSVYNSSLSAAGKITVQKGNTINGDVASPLAISNAGKINGAVTVRPVAIEPLPSRIYSAGGLNKIVPSGGALVLAPGSYNVVTLNSGGTLKLTSGDYFFNELRYPGSEAVIEFDLASNKAASVNVVSNLQFGKEATIRLLPNGESDSELVTFFTLQSTAMSLGKEAYFLGTLNAPNASVTLVKNSQLRGSICANEILVSTDCLFLHHDSPGTLPGPGNLPKSSFDDDEQTATSNEHPVTSYQLEQNYPNPFNPATTISFALPQASEVTLSIFSLSGQLVKRLVAGELNAGRHNLVWDATNERGERVASGVYLYGIKTGAFAAQKKLVLMK